jgi:hypothetical protein
MLLSVAKGGRAPPTGRIGLVRMAGSHRREREKQEDTGEAGSSRFASGFGERGIEEAAR